MRQTEVIIIGAGVIGCAIARSLSRYAVDIAVLEQACDVCEGTSKANSAIVHAGFDAEVGSLKAKLNAEGNRMMDEISETLDVPFKRIGALVVCFSVDDVPKLEALRRKGEENGIPGLRVLNREEAVALEPNLSDEVAAALYAPTSGIVCPFELTLGFAENAANNGVNFFFHTKVERIEKTDEGFSLQTTAGEWRARAVINAAGVYADVIHNMVCEQPMGIVPRKGEYLLMDRKAGSFVSHTVFQLPGRLGKGVLVTPTVHGNLLAGPTAQDIENKEGSETSREGLMQVVQKAALSVAPLPLSQVITGFAGLRAHDTGDDFILQESAPFFFEAAGMESPGLSASPAVGEFMAKMISDKLNLAQKSTFNPIRKGVPKINEMTTEARRLRIEENPAYGEIICRCEEISEGEVLDAIRRPLGATTLDGVKRRTRAGMGRCQSGFCSPRIMEILSRELGIPLETVRKNQPGSEIVVGKSRQEDNGNEM